MKKMFKLPVIATLVLALTTPVMAETNFSDVVEGEWYVNAINSAIENDLLGGYEDATMRPSATISRAEISTILTKAFGASKKALLNKYNDVTSRDWFYEAMAKAVNMGLFVGNSEGELNPNAPITREEAAVVITKAFDLTGENETLLDKYSDKNTISAWAKPYVLALVENGYMSGNEKGQLNPKGNMTRAEFAQIMYNITDNYIVEKGTVTNDYEGTLVVRVQDVVLKDATVNGDIIVADGVGTGDFTLDNVEVNGNIVIRGGGVNSVKLLNKIKIRGNIIARNPNGKTRIHAEEPIESDLLVNSAVIIDAECANVVVNTTENVEVKGKVESMEVVAEEAKIEVTGKVESIAVNATDVEITGSGDVKKVEANADNVVVEVKDAKVTAAEGVSGVVAGNKDVAAGTSQTVKPSTSGGGSGSSSKPSYDKALTFTIDGENSRYYSIKSDATVADFDGIDGTTKYYITVTVTGTEISQSKIVSDSASAVNFIADIILKLGDTQMHKVAQSIDNMNQSLFTEENYLKYKNIANELNVREYIKELENIMFFADYLKSREDEIESVKAEQIYLAFKDAGRSVQGIIDDARKVENPLLLDLVIDKLISNSSLTNMINSMLK